MAIDNANGHHVSAIPLIINGEDVQTTTSFDVTSPVTGEVIYQSSSASVEDVRRAAESAQMAFREWSKLKPHARQELLFKAASIMEARKEELMQCQMKETGALRIFAEFTFGLGISFLKDWAGRILSLEGSVPTVAAPGQSAIVIKEPYGVILGIAPWNAPLVLGTRAIALPLAAGNSTILKGSEFCPKTFWTLGDIFRQAGLPKGCVNVLFHRPADAAEVTTALIAHPAVKKINFTGSSHVGAIIASTAGKYIKPVLLELGGKASSIVLDDADMQKAALTIARAAFFNSGQICMSTERIVVQRAVADKFRQALTEAAEAEFGKSVDAPFLVSSAPVEKVRRLVSDAVSKGASILFGDNNAQESAAASYRPVIVEQVTKEMDLYAAESFGPTVSLYVVDTEEEAIALANDTEYGLTSAVFTEDLRRGLRVAKQLESGACHINGMTVRDESNLPHGGYKSSGFGRFGGLIGFEEFVQTKTITWMD